MGYPILDLDVSRPFPTVPLADDADGVAVLLRRRTRPVAFWIEPLPPRPAPGGAAPGGAGRVLTSEDLGDQAVRHARRALVRAALREELRGRGGAAPLPSLTVAVCTRDRPDVLARCLRSVAAARAAGGRPRGRGARRRQRPARRPDARGGRGGAGRPLRLRAAGGAELRPQPGAPRGVGRLGRVPRRRRRRRPLVARRACRGPRRSPRRRRSHGADPPVRARDAGAGPVRGAGRVSERVPGRVRDGPLRAAAGGRPALPRRGRPVRGRGQHGVPARRARGARRVRRGARHGRPAPRRRRPRRLLPRRPGGAPARLRAVVPRLPRAPPRPRLAGAPVPELGARVHGVRRQVVRRRPGLPARPPADVRAWFRRQARQVAGAVRARDRQRAAFLAAEVRGGVVGLLGEYARSERRVQRIRERHP